jgi:hypothetical protein
MPRFSMVFTFAILSLGGCTESRKPTHGDVSPDMERASLLLSVEHTQHSIAAI